MSPSTSTAEHKPPRFYASKDALCQDLFNCAKLDALALSHCPNYWIPREVLEIDDSNSTDQLLTSFEAIVAAVSPLAKRHLSDNTEDWSGAEVWCQIYKNGRGLGMHFDKDEALVLEEGRLVTPILSSVLFLTGTDNVDNEEEERKSNSDHHHRHQQQKQQQRQSPLILTNQAFKSTLNTPIPDDPTHTTLIFPVSNTYILFYGDLGHGVLDGADDAPERATLLINWWKERPKSLHRISVDEVVDGKLLDTSDVVLEKYTKSWDELARRSRTRMLEKMMGVGEDDGEEKEDGIEICQLNVSLDDTRLQDDGDEEDLALVTVDELLEEAGVTLVLGKDNGDDGHSKHKLVDGCSISHPGFAMLPIESPGLQVLAGFVPLSQLE